MGRAAPSQFTLAPAIDINAPSGESGPGYFRQPYSLSDTGLPSPSPVQRKGPAAGLWVAQAKTPTSTGGKAAQVNPPPKTNAMTSTLKTKSTNTNDIDIKVQVLADGSDSSLPATSAKTSFSFSSVNWSTPDYDGKREGGKISITKFKGKFTLKGTITIQTNYGSKATATKISLYGRGTTKTDKTRGNVTLGFHENCHQKDYLNYLKKNALPIVDLKVGMTADEFKQAETKFKAAFAKYQKDMETASTKATDEVGYKLSKCKADGKCPK